jgi:hypothetical protein
MIVPSQAFGRRLSRSAKRQLAQRRLAFIKGVMDASQLKVSDPALCLRDCKSKQLSIQEDTSRGNTKHGSSLLSMNTEWNNTLGELAKSEIRFISNMREL